VLIEEGAVRPAMPNRVLEQLWAEHLAGEFVNKDMEATLATIVACHPYDLAVIEYRAAL